MRDLSNGTKDDRAAVDKAVSLLKAFGQDGHLGLGVSELARRADLSKSTAFRLLAMLERNGVVERASQAYRLGPVLQELGTRPNEPAHDNVRDLLTPHLADLYEATHHTVHLAVLQGTSVVYLNKLFGHQRIVSPSRIGGRAPAYCTGVGKILLAHDEVALEAVLVQPMHPWTRSTITTPERLRRELNTARRDGIAHDNGESLDGLRCIAAPIFGPGQKAIAAMSISGDSKFIPAQFEHMLRQVCYAASRTIALSRRTSFVA